MLDTDNACVLAGMAAIGAIVWSRNQEQTFFTPNSYPTACSAMKASVEDENDDSSDGVLAMKSGVEEETGGPMWESLFPATSKEFKDHYADATATPKGGFYSASVQKAQRELRPKYQIQTNHSSELGNSIPVAGREFDYFKPKRIKVKGGCMLYQTEAYAEQIESQKEEEVEEEEVAETEE